MGQKQSKPKEAKHLSEEQYKNQDFSNQLNYKWDFKCKNETKEQNERNERKISNIRNGLTILKSTLNGHSYGVLSLCYLDNGLLASGSRDNSIKIWRISTGKLVTTLKGHSDYVSSLSYLDNGLLASGSSDYSIKIWSLDN